MSSLPLRIERAKVPPIKCQGIKTKLVPFIFKSLRWADDQARWIEPFLGSGVVALNLAPTNALLTDSNQHIVHFYQSIQRGEINSHTVHEFLLKEGKELAEIGADYYYQVRDRFNQEHSPLDFLFLNRACFNGMIRFNRSGEFNVPFCRKPQRFSPSYITKIVNQVQWASQQIQQTWEFRVAHWKDILQEAHPKDFVYLDPPYIGRHVNYYNAWSLEEAEQLASVTATLPCGYAVSMWLENHHRKNDHIQHCWSELEIRVCQHFYYVGSKENWRGAIVEALLIKPGFAATSTRS